MNRSRTQKILLSLLRRKNQISDSQKNFSDYVKAKDQRKMKISVRRFFIDIFLIMLGVLSAGFGLGGFFAKQIHRWRSRRISLLISELSQLSLPLLLVIVNTPFIILGYKLIGKLFAIKTAIAIAALAVVVAVIPYPQITQDKLLIAIFGGFFLGLGIGLAVRGGGVIDGTEVLAISLSKRLGLTVGDIILVVNIIIFSVAAYVLSVETALYSILTYLSASKTVDFVIEGIEEYTGVTIISVKAEDIRTMIIETMGRGVTIFKGEKGYGKRGHTQGEIKIIYTVITRLEVSKLNVKLKKSIRMHL